MCHLAAKTDLEWCGHLARRGSTMLSNVERRADMCEFSLGPSVYISTAVPWRERSTSRWRWRSAPDQRVRTRQQVLQRRLRSPAPRAAVRCTVVGPDGKDHKFIGRIIEQLRRASRIIDQLDKKGSPTYAPDFAVEPRCPSRNQQASGSSTWSPRECHPRRRRCRPDRRCARRAGHQPRLIDDFKRMRFSHLARHRSAL